MTVTFRQLGDDWQGPITTDRRLTPFTAGWEDTVNLLHIEVAALGEERHPLIVVQVDADRLSFRQDGRGLLASATLVSPRVVVSFDTRHGPLRYQADRFNARRNGQGWRHNVRAIALTLQALRAVDRWGVGGRGEQYRGWTALGAGGPYASSGSLGDARGLLLRWWSEADGPAPAHPLDWTPGAVRAAYRRAAAGTHPDVGGNADMFRAVTAARDLLLGAAP